MKRILSVILGLALAAACLPALAATAPDNGPKLLPPRLEARYQALTSQLRCPVCQNEPIATSQTQIAGALRKIVRQKLLAGETNQQIKQYMISRYGLFAVYKPPLDRGTMLLWFGPFLLLLLGIIVAALAIRRRRHALSNSEAGH
ncbi:MAG TPA: cytochrome c-type biogenesis protein [Gammaproteobacteria bacterium]|nr:cytochrome c-type biogenesis protein [Gammaproteobacteria bacterium]